MGNGNLRLGRLFPLLVILATTFAPAQRVANADTEFVQALRFPPVVRDSDITITAQESLVQIFPSGPPTKMWTYNGMYPAPTIRRPSGLPTRLTVNNQLPADSGEITVHHHGNHSASSEDGQPNRELIAVGGSRTYTYLGMEGGLPERGAFQWYHDHRMGLTCRNVEKGLVGMSILDDGFDSFLGLPTDDAYDVPLMISDVRFDADNQIVDQCPTGGLTTPPPFDNVGAGQIMVNGTPQPYFEVADRKYRLRFLNGSTAQFYNLEMPGLTMHQVATESGLLPATTNVCAAGCPRTSLLLGPAERVEVIVDFSGRVGESFVLRTLPRLAALTTGSQSRFTDVMRFDVTRSAETDAPAVPATLRELPAWTKTVVPVPTRTWEFGPGADAQRGTTAWVVNGKPYDPDAAPGATPRLDSQETWALVNHSVTYLGLGSPTHVVHIHAVDWVILSRNGVPPPPWEAGLKETFFLDAEEVLVVAAAFPDHLGEYMLHCHLLPHEDNSMMASFEVIA